MREDITETDRVRRRRRKGKGAISSTCSRQPEIFGGPAAAAAPPENDRDGLLYDIVPAVADGVRILSEWGAAGSGTGWRFD